MSIGDRIKWLRKEKCDFTQEEVGIRIGVGKATVQKYENGIINTISSDKVEKMAEMFDSTPGFIMGWDASEPNYPGDSDINRFVNNQRHKVNGSEVVKIPKNIRLLGDFSSHRIPLIGSAAAGEPIFNEEIDVYVDGPLKADCAIRVQGDSMEPTFLDGDTLYIRSQPDIDHDGQIAVVICGDDACVKHVYRKPYGLLLVSENPKYDPKEKRAEDFDGNLRILGKVIGFTRIYKE